MFSNLEFLRKRKFHPIWCIICVFITLILFILSQLCFHPSKDFSTFTEELFRKEVSANTLTLHYSLKNPSSMNIHDYEVHLGTYPLPYENHQQKEFEKIKRQLNQYDKHRLSLDEQVTYDVLLEHLNLQSKLCEYAIFEEPASPLGGIVTELPLLFAEFPFDSKQDIKDYLALLQQTGRYLNEIFLFEQEKSVAGLFMPSKLCQKTIQICKNFADQEHSAFLFSSFEEKIKKLPKLSDAERTTLIQQNQEILTRFVFPAYEKFANNLSTLTNKDVNNLGLCHLPGGKDYYTALIHAYSGCSDSMEEINNRIQTARNQDFSQCSLLMKTHSSLIKACNNVTLNITDEHSILSSLLQQTCTDFPSIPPITYKVHSVETSLQDVLAPAFYITAPMDDYQTHHIYINTAADYPSLSYFTTLAHEGFPGHLYQTVMSYHYNLSHIRSLLNFPGYTEGWATYAEMQSYHYAGLPAPAAEFFSHEQSGILSLYASSDIGIHYYGWNYSDLCKFWTEYGISDQNTIRSIMDVILSSPGNYLKYYLGYLEIVDIKNSMKELYGNDFLEKNFHEALLKIGPAPFDIVRRYIPIYYNNC